MPKAPIIETIGLKKYLDMTANMHDGKTYKDFVKLIDAEPTLTDTDIAAVFNVTQPTVFNWKHILSKERAK